MVRSLSIKLLIAASWLACAASCNSNSGSGNEYGYDQDAQDAVLLSDSAANMPFLSARYTAINAALHSPLPVLLSSDTLNADQRLAQELALRDSSFTANIFSQAGDPLRNEILGVYPARESDLSELKGTFQLGDVYRVEMYNYALNSSSIALVDVKRKTVIDRYQLQQTQPEISQALKTIAIKIAVNSPVVQSALGIKPNEADALMASTKTSLNRSRCERSRHLCVAPTFVKGDKALWAIVDLTDHRVVGIRWTSVGSTGPAAPIITERKLQDDKISSCFCETEQSLKQQGWDMKYMLTSSDGLRISDVSFNNKPILRSAKLVDWHVSYSGTDGFGYSDAVGCPYFSQAAVVAWEAPMVSQLVDDKNKVIGFTLEQTFRSEGWPQPCNYNYRQRYEFYNDGRFRVAAASVGRGCGNTGTYRPVFRIAFAGDANNFFERKDDAWQQWQQEGWSQQSDLSDYTAEGYLYRIGNNASSFYVEPGAGNFKDGGRGDFAYVYVTKHAQKKNEGESDMLTIGPCCNTDYKQGPEKFIEPQPESIANSSLVFWYVAQLRNDDRKGNEYCWAESVLENGIYKTKTYPCFCGPLFVPVK